MRPKFKTPKEVAVTEHRERFGVNLPKEYLDYLRQQAGKQNITVGVLINEAVRAYVEFLREHNEPPSKG